MARLRGGHARVRRPLPHWTRRAQLRARLALRAPRRRCVGRSREERGAAWRAPPRLALLRRLRRHKALEETMRRHKDTRAALSLAALALVLLTFSRARAQEARPGDEQTRRVAEIQAALREANLD